MREIFVGEPLEFFVAENGAQAGIIVVKTIADTKPVLTIVNLEPLEGIQPIVWFDETFRDFFCRTTVNPFALHRVAQIHIAGHSKFQKYILDTHDHPVIDPVWKLYERAIQRTGKTATLLEWDDRIPSFDEVHDEALKAGKFLKRLENELVSA